MLKNSVFMLLFLSLLSSQAWVAKYGEEIFYEEDLFRYVQKKDWMVLDLEKKRRVLLDFLKQEVGVSKAKVLGLQYEEKTYKKIKGRFERLLVNEYYMRDFLGKIIPKEKISFCQQNLKKEVFVNHVLLPLDSQGLVLSGLIKDSLLMRSGSFQGFARTHSIDPSAQQNQGVLGWISVGQTVPEFQDAIFSLCLGCVSVVATDFGYHVVRVDSVKSSKYALLDRADYNDFAFRFASGYITENLAEKAAAHDSLLLKEEDVFLSRAHLNRLVLLIQKEKERIGAQTRKDVNVLGVLSSYPDVIASYGGNLLTASWFVNKINAGFYKNVFYDNVDQMYIEFITMLIRDIVFYRALDLQLNFGESFDKQFVSIEKDVLYKAFLKNLLNSVPDPTLQEIEVFYNNKEDKGLPLDKASDSIRAVLLQEKQKEAQALYELNVEEFSILNVGWIKNE